MLLSEKTTSIFDRPISKQRTLYDYLEQRYILISLFLKFILSSTLLYSTQFLMKLNYSLWNNRRNKIIYAVEF